MEAAAFAFVGHFFEGEEDAGLVGVAGNEAGHDKGDREGPGGVADANAGQRDHGHRLGNPERPEARAPEG